MKNIFIYYLAISIPLAAIFYLKDIEVLNSGQWLGLFAFYLLVYRTYTDGKRLADKNLISKKDIWKLIIPGKRIGYLRELYLK